SVFFFFQAEDGIRDDLVTGVQTCALPISMDMVTLHVGGVSGSNGDTFQPEHALKMQALVEEAPDVQGANAYIMRPLMFAGIANARADAVSANDKKGPFLFMISRGQMGSSIAKELNGLPVVTTTQVNNMSRKGSATNF